MNNPAPIAPLSPDHAASAAALWEACGLVRPWNDPVGDFLRAVSGPSSAVLGLVHDDAVLASAMVGTDGHRGWVHYVAVHPDRRREGLGVAIMRAAEEWLRDAAAPKVQLMVRSTNRAVLGFYTALGYTDQDTLTLGRFLDPDLERLRRGHS